MGCTRDALGKWGFLIDFFASNRYSDETFRVENRFSIFTSFESAVFFFCVA